MKTSILQKQRFKMIRMFPNTKVHSYSHPDLLLMTMPAAHAPMSMEIMGPSHAGSGTWMPQGLLQGVWVYSLTIDNTDDTNLCEGLEDLTTHRQGNHIPCLPSNSQFPTRLPHSSESHSKGMLSICQLFLAYATQTLRQTWVSHDMNITSKVL